MRNLEREIGTVCRKVARQVAEGTLERKVSVTEPRVRELLGRPRFQSDVVKRRTRGPGRGDRPGVDAGRRRRAVRRGDRDARQRAARLTSPASSAT